MSEHPEVKSLRRNLMWIVVLVAAAVGFGAYLLNERLSFLESQVHYLQQRLNEQKP